MPAKDAVTERPLSVDDVVYAPVSLPRRVQTVARAQLAELHHPRPRQVELLALDLLIAVEAVLVLFIIVSVG